MGFLNNLKTDSSIEEAKDSVGGNGVLETGVYPFTVDLAYLDSSAKGAYSLNLRFTNADGKQLRTSLWMTSGTDKGQKNYYEGKDGKKRYLPGFITANELSLLTCDCEISEQEPEEKVINVYNPDLGKEAPTKKKVFTDMLGKEILLGVQKIIKDKYNTPNESQEINEINKVFHAETKMTVNEYRSEETEASFINAWISKHEGKSVDKRDASKDSSGGSEEAPKKKGSLFG